MSLELGRWLHPRLDPYDIPLPKSGVPPEKAVSMIDSSFSLLLDGYYVLIFFL
jgi:hypothetical protein